MRVLLLYVRALLGEFRPTLLILLGAVVLGTILHAITRQPELNGERPSIGVSVYAAWMALFAQPLYSPPHAWYLMVLYCVYPILGFILIGEGVVRLALLMASRRRGEKEWMMVVTSTYRDHVVLCGLGHLGFRVLEQLAAANTPVVVLERTDSNPFLAQVKAMNVPVLIRDMKEDQALIDAGIRHASAVIIASNDDIANLEVAIDSRRMNPKIRIVMRLFDQQLAEKIAGALPVDAAFSSSALAAPVVAAMSLHSRVLASMMIAGQSYVTAELRVEDGSAITGKPIGQIEAEHQIRVLSRTDASGVPEPRPRPDDRVAAGDMLVVHTMSSRLTHFAAAARDRG